MGYFLRKVLRERRLLEGMLYPPPPLMLPQEAANKDKPKNKKVRVKVERDFLVEMRFMTDLLSLETSSCILVSKSVPTFVHLLQ